MPKIDSLDHFVLTVVDPEKTASFYSRVLGTEPEVFYPDDGSIRIALRFGDQKINLHQSGAEFKPNARYAASGTADLCFLSTTPLSDWQAHLSAEFVEVESGPIPRTGARGPILSIYIRDLDGNLIEISNQV